FVEALHGLVAFDRVVDEGGLAGKLYQGRNAGESGIDHLADRIDDRLAADRVAEPPPAHAVGLAERETRHTLFEHAWLGLKWMMLAEPDHVVVRLIAEDRDISAANQVGNPFEVSLGGDSARRIVGTVKKDGAS